MVNFVIVITIESHIFSSYWMQDRESGSNSLLKSFMEVIRYFYRVPINTVDTQCYKTDIQLPVIDKRMINQ